MTAKMLRALAPLLMALAPPAGAFDLAFPAGCTLGQDCYIQQYHDHDPGPEATDYTCGPLSYDGHDGTDIALPTRAAMAAGVAVLAAPPAWSRACATVWPMPPPSRPGKTAAMAW